MCQSSIDQIARASLSEMSSTSELCVWWMVFVFAKSYRVRSDKSAMGLSSRIGAIEGDLRVWSENAFPSVKVLGVEITTKRRLPVTNRFFDLKSVALFQSP
jgi:hypothetical protein